MGHYIENNIMSPSQLESVRVKTVMSHYDTRNTDESESLALH